jgi:hypothetical protein
LFLSQALRGKGHSLVGFAFFATADLDRHFSVKPFQKIEQLVSGETAEVPVHQVRHVGLRNSQDMGDFALPQVPLFEDFEDVESDLRARQKLVGILEAQIREDVSGPSSNSIGFRLFVLMGQLLRFQVSLLD